MKNFKMKKGLVELLLVGSISLSTVSGTVKAESKENSGSLSLTDHIGNLSEDVSLEDSPYNGFTILSPVQAMMQEYQEYDITEAICSAVTIKEANVRTGPSTECDRIDTLHKGTMVEVLAKTNNGWYLISHDGEMYFTIGTNIQILSYTLENGEMIENIPPIVDAIQATSNLNVREKATKDSRKLGMISGNRTFKVLERLDNGWIKIDYRGQVAYVMGKYTKDTLMIDGPFYNFVYLKNDSYLYDLEGNVLREVSQFEGGKVYYENEIFYLVSLGDDFGYILKNQCKRISGTFVNIDLSLQQLEILDVSTGEVFLTTDVITGKDSSPSDIGLFAIYGIRHDTYLSSDSYNVHVDHFAPYNGGEGLHDAPWQDGNFGKVDFYHKGGSHGCINMPPEITEEVFSLIKTKMQVLVHK